MTDKPDVPTEPPDDDVVIWEHVDTGSYVVTWWTIFCGRLIPNHYDTEKKADKAIQEAVAYAQVHRVDVWRRRDDKPAHRWKRFRPRR